MEHTHLGHRISIARKDKGYSEAEFGMHLGVKASTIKKWENEKIAPRANRLHMMSGILNVPLLWLLAGGDHIPEPEGAYTDQDAMNFKLEQAENSLQELGTLLAEMKILVTLRDH
ncbi:MAG: transcriptional regulator with XRE-family HTH domain [Cocleimonas sp.]|jgi:transcriptional regulator with XRE-family HTH domain